MVCSLTVLSNCHRAIDATGVWEDNEKYEKQNNIPSRLDNNLIPGLLTVFAYAERADT